MFRTKMAWIGEDDAGEVTSSCLFALESNIFTFREFLEICGCFLFE